MKRIISRCINFGILILLSILVFSCNKGEEPSVRRFANPITLNEADPWVYYHPIDGYYYYTATYKDYDRVVVKKAKSLNSLKYNAEDEYEILRANKGPLAGKVYSYIWAPELHYCDGTWYLFFTGSETGSNVWAVRSQVAVCHDEDPIRGSWDYLGIIKGYTAEEPSTNIMAGTFNLDGTAFCIGDQWYYAWAQYLYDDGWADEEKVAKSITINGKRYDNGLGGGDWSSILIGKTSIEDFTTVTDVMVLTVPTYPWEYGKDSRFTHSGPCTNVNEGPAILQHGNTLTVVYSASSCDEAYCLGMVWCDMTKDILDINNWTKSEEPVLSSSVKNGIYGPGHCSFTKDGSDDVIIYHARNYYGIYDGSNNVTGEGLNDPHRSARAKIFTWNDNGTPYFGEAE